MNTWLMIATVVTLMILVPLVSSSYEACKLTGLPGQPPVNFQQFGGYITVDEPQQRNLFYYFVEAENNASTKPLVLWLNGGPGCSSVGGGAFTENGPFRPSSEHSLIKNDYSWNKEANMLYLESPAGVGFSYSVNKSFYDGVNDKITANDNLVFLQNWLKKYTQYEHRDFFIAGESYGGHYVPQLADLVLKSSLKLNLKGIALGDPLLDFNSDMNANALYLWSHGLISDETLDLLQNVCNYSQIRRQNRKGRITPPCAMVYSQMSNEIGSLVNLYDILHQYCHPTHFSQILNLMDNVKVDICIDDKTKKYLNKKDVQKAMNARLVGANEWVFCSNNEIVIYDLDELDAPILPLLKSLIKAGVHVFVYSGDQDSVLPLTGTRTLVKGLARELGLKATVPYRFWLATSQEVGGWTQVYGDILTFTTIRGGAHEAPSTQPRRSLVLFHYFLSGKPLPKSANMENEGGMTRSAKYEN